MDESVLAKFAMSGASACVAETATYPLDLLKARLQLNRLSSPPGLARTVAQILLHEGPAALYAGLAPALLRHLPYTGIRLALFEQLRDLAQERRPGQLPLATTLCIGLLAGGTGQLAAVPADLIKLRMQADARAVASGLQAAPRYRGLAHALAAVVRQDGVRGLWYGSLPAVQRAALVNLGELATYDAAKRAVLQSGVTGGDNVQAHALSAAASGFCSSVISTPADVVKTRLMSQNRAVRLQYSGMVDCLMQTWRNEGLHGLYKGFLPTWARLGPWQLMFWVTLEQLRGVSGLRSF